MSGINIRIPHKAAKWLIAGSVALGGLAGTNAVSYVKSSLIADYQCAINHQLGNSVYAFDTAVVHQNVRRGNFESFMPSTSLNPYMPKYLSMLLKITSYPVEMSLALTYPIHSGIGQEIGLEYHGRHFHTQIPRQRRKRPVN